MIKLPSALLAPLPAIISLLSTTLQLSMYRHRRLPSCDAKSTDRDCSDMDIAPT